MTRDDVRGEGNIVPVVQRIRFVRKRDISWEDSCVSDSPASSGEPFISSGIPLDGGHFILQDIHAVMYAVG